MIWTMAVQLPKILRAIVLEYIETEKLARQLQLDSIISDNRYGCFSRRVRSIFITHQLNIQIGWPLLEWIVRIGNHRWIRLFFRECWVPDSAHTPNLSGKLAHGTSLHALHFIGILSRMQRMDVSKKYDAIVVLSGPEPQRTVLEEKILAQVKNLSAKILIVGGCPEQQKSYPISDTTSYISFLPSVALNEAMLASDVIISRSGYSTVMDVAQLGKKAIFIPTPGQTEQEYLAAHFYEQKIFYTQSQDELDLATALKAVQNFSGFQQMSWENKDLQARIESLL